MNWGPYPGRSLGPPLNTNIPGHNYQGHLVDSHDTRRHMPQVSNPCDLFGPLAKGSNWPYEVLIYPGAARPAYASTFNIYSEVEVTVTGTWIDVVSISLDQSEEGRVLKWAGVEEGAAGSDLFWRIVKDESSPGRYDVMRGGWSSIAFPQDIITPIPTGSKLALQVFLPVAGGAPRTVRGLIRGWAAPFDGGGTFAGGFGRS
jgi:hypothetical protein